MKGVGFVETELPLKFEAQFTSSKSFFTQTNQKKSKPKPHFIVMNFQIFLVGFFYTCVSRVYGAADGWVDLGGITVPTDECIFDGDGNSYIFTCDSDGNMTSNFYSGEIACAGTPITTPVSGLEYECNPVGFVETEVIISNPFTGSSDCAISYASTAIATDICHYSNLDGAYVMYVISPACF